MEYPLIPELLLQSMIDIKFWWLNCVFTSFWRFLRLNAAPVEVKVFAVSKVYRETTFQ